MTARADGLRLVRLILGLFLFALGSYLTIQANIGLAPWEAFSMGVSRWTHLSYGSIVMLTGLVIIGIDYALREKIGVGTILNAILIGQFVDWIAATRIIPVQSSFFPGLLMLLIGQFIVCLGSYFYIGAALGCGPRDALMVAIGRRNPRVPIGLIRGMIEGSALAIGWLLGAKIGVGTILSVFGIGLIMQLTFALLRFDVKAIVHEPFPETARRQVSRLIRLTGRSGPG